MKVGIGYSDNPESNTAGLQAVNMAIDLAGRTDPCDMALLFSTARHDFAVLRSAVSSVIGDSVPIYGGGAAGVITNDYYGYAGDQIAAACIWLDGVNCKAAVEGSLGEGEKKAGGRLGKKLAGLGLKPDSPVMLFYETFDFTEGVRMMMATWLLSGIEGGLGFIPNLAGAGLMGSHGPVPTSQWIGGKMGEHNAIALAFSGDIRMDSVIMHGCRPATGYYTVTKADGQAILEINGKPAIQFIDGLLDSSIAPEQYPFFLIFGINHGERWGEYDENYYANRLCLSIDKDAGAIIMFEPDMVEGTEFRLMFRSMEPGYIKPKIDKIFEELDGRDPVFAVYINCAGRCSGYGGNDLEDAIVLRDAIAGRIPLLGLYTGVEIASIGGRPRGLDWTGVLCLFSQSKNGGKTGRSIQTGKHGMPVWNAAGRRAGSKEAPQKVLTRLCEHNAARYLALDASTITIRYELENKRRGFSLLSELSYSLRQKTGYENLFIPASKRINSALNMQRTVVLTWNGKGRFSIDVLQGYTAEEKIKLTGRPVCVPVELLDADNPVCVNGADSDERFRELREMLGLPYFISSPIILQGEIYAILLTGRIVESAPYLIRLSRGDVETVQAIGALLASVLYEKRIAALEEHDKIMVEAMPICCFIWDERGNLTDCNKEALYLFGLDGKEEFIRKFYSLSPEYQPDGGHSKTVLHEYVMKAFLTGGAKFKWMHKTLGGELIPADVTLVRIPKGEDYIVAGYTRDLREAEAAEAKMAEAKELTERYIKAKNEFLASVSHEIRTPMNAVRAMAQIAGKFTDITESQRNIVNQGLYSIQLLTSAIETILDFSKLDSGQLSLEIGEFSVRKLIGAIGEMARGEAAAKSLYFKVFVGESVPDILLGDFARVQQTLFNVVINAVKFTETGGVDIRVFSDDILNEGKAAVTFEVRDTGIGITGGQMENLFKPLYSGDTSYSRKHGGLGMGLAVSGSLAALMGGEITCESRPGEGSVFYIKIPFAVPEPETKKSGIKEAGKASEADTEALIGLRVLAAEDNNINQIIIQELLTCVGIEVTIADNGIMALEKLAAGSFDIVLMDIQMPKMDGLTAASQIRSDHRYDDLPILAMTANVGAEHVKESFRAGMNDHLTKPVDAGQLYGALLKWSGRKTQGNI